METGQEKDPKTPDHGEGSTEPAESHTTEGSEPSRPTRSGKAGLLPPPSTGARRKQKMPRGGDETETSRERVRSHTGDQRSFA